MTTIRTNPDGEENQRMSRDNERAVFAAKMEAQARCLRCRQFIARDYANACGLCEDCEHEDRCEEHDARNERTNP